MPCGREAGDTGSHDDDVDVFRDLCRVRGVACGL
jgi:hypothetical protein